MTKASYHHGSLRSALIEAGLAALESPGATDDLSLRLLARQVGVTANAAYRHFKDKDDLLNAMAAEGFRRFAQRQTEAVQGLSEVAAQLSASGRAYISFALAHPALFRMMFNRVSMAVSAQSGHAELLEACTQAMGVLLQSTAKLHQASVGDGQATVSAAACWALVHGLSDLALGGQLAVFGMDPLVLIDRVMSMPPGVPMPSDACGPKGGGPSTSG